MSQLNGFTKGVINDVALLKRRTPSNVQRLIQQELKSSEQFDEKLLRTVRDNHKAFLEVLSPNIDQDFKKGFGVSSLKLEETNKQPLTLSGIEIEEIPKTSLPERLQQISEKINPPFKGIHIQPIRLPNIHFIEMGDATNVREVDKNAYLYLKNILEPHKKDKVVFFIHGFTSNSNELVARCLEGLQNLPSSVGQVYVMPISWEDASEDFSFSKHLLKKSVSLMSPNPFATARAVIADSVDRAETIGRALLQVIQEVSLERYGLVSHSMGSHAANVVMASQNLKFKPMFNLMLNPHVYKKTIIKAFETQCSYGSTPTWVLCNENDDVLKRSRSVNEIECLGDVTSSPGYVYGQYTSTVLVGKNFKTYIIRDFEAEVNDSGGTRHKAYNNPIMKKMVGSLMDDTHVLAVLQVEKLN